MENRTGKRTNENISVLFYNEGVPVSVGKTKNIAPNGAFVEKGYQSDNGGKDILVTFVMPNKNETKFCCVNAHIVHRTQTGLGLMIDNFDEGAIFPIKENKA